MGAEACLTSSRVVEVTKATLAGFSRASSGTGLGGKKRGEWFGGQQRPACPDGCPRGWTFSPKSDIFQCVNYPSKTLIYKHLHF